MWPSLGSGGPISVDGGELPLLKVTVTSGLNHGHLEANAASLGVSLGHSAQAGVGVNCSPGTGVWGGRLLFLHCLLFPGLIFWACWLELEHGT